MSFTVYLILALSMISADDERCSVHSSFNRATMDLLTEGINKGVAVIGIVRCLVKSEIQAPLYYLLCDSDQNSFILTVFGIQKEAVNRFLENSERSLTGFLDSASTNPDSDGVRQMQMTLQLLDKLERLLQGNSDDKSKGNSKGKNKGKSKAKNKGKSKETSLSSLIESLTTFDLNPSFDQATMDLLTGGFNKGVAVIGRVRCLVKSEIQAPLYYMLCDSDQNSFVLAVFGLQNEAIKQGDQVTLLDPFCNFIDFEWKGNIEQGDQVTLLEHFCIFLDFEEQGKHYKFKSVLVNLLEQVTVNGNAYSPNLAICESLYAKSKA